MCNSKEKQIETTRALIALGVMTKGEKGVGNCIMKNPGSSFPLQSISNRKDERLEFSVDATMRAVAELFRIDKYGGTVRIFNLSDMRNAHFNQIKTSLRSSCCDIAEELSKAPQIPTYIGWGDMWKDERFRQRAENIFNIVKGRSSMLNKNIDENPFFHPLYLMRYARNNPECLRIVESFRQELPPQPINTLFYKQNQ